MLESVTDSVPPEMKIPPPCQTRKVLAFGQFLVVSSDGGVGRKFREGRVQIPEDSIEIDAISEIRSPA